MSSDAFDESTSGRAARTDPAPGYREDLVAVLTDMLDGRPDTRPGLMFGFPAFYAAGKLVACVYGAGIGLRVAPDRASELRGAPTPAFQPYGRLMRSWTFLEPAAGDDLRAEVAVIEAAIDRAKREGTAR